MAQPVTVGLDIAKNIFHDYVVDAQGEKVLSRKLRRLATKFADAAGIRQTLRENSEER